MKYTITLLVLSFAFAALAYGPDPSTITNWADKVKLYNSGVHRISVGKRISRPARNVREPSVTAVNLFMEEEILRYNNEQAAEMQKQFPRLPASEVAVWKTMTWEQKKSYRTRYKAAWLDAFVDTTTAEYTAWKAMTEAERAVWEEAWSKAHKGCTEFVPPPLIEVEASED